MEVDDSHQFSKAGKVIGEGSQFVSNIPAIGKGAQTDCYLGTY